MLLIAGIAFAAASALLLAAIAPLFGSPLPMVRVQWGDVSASDRNALERQFQLTEATALGDRLWIYVPIDRSPATLRAIVSHPAVQDTDGINRRTFAIAENPPLTPRRGGRFAGAPPWMARGARALAYLLAAIGGVLLSAAVLIALVMPLAQRAARARPGESIRRTYAFALRHRQAPVIVALVLLAAGWRFLTFTGFSNDHYAHLAMAQQVLMGDRPIRDFADPGWPLTYMLTAAGWTVAGKLMAVEWFISTAGFAIGAACTVAAAYRLSGSLAIAAIVTLIEIIVFPRGYSYPKVLVYAASACAMLTLAANPARGHLLMAAIVAVAFLLRHDHGLFIGVSAAACIALGSLGDGRRVAITRIARLTAATALLLLPWIVFVMINGGLGAYLEAALDYSRAEAMATRLRSLPVAGPEAWLFWVYWSLPVICSGAALRRLRHRSERWRGESAVVCSLAAIAVMVNASFLRESLEVRAADAIVPAALLGAWALGLCWAGRWQHHLGQRMARVATAAIVAVSAVAAARVAGFGAQFEDSGIPQGVAGVRAHAAEVSQRLASAHREDVPSRYSLALRPFFDYVDRCTSTADRLIVTAEFPDVLVLAGRKFAGDGVVFGSWYASVTHQDRTIARLRAEPALFVLHMGDSDAFRSKYQMVNAYIDANYRSMAEVPVDEGGTIRILVQRARGASVADVQTGWPCFPRAGEDRPPPGPITAGRASQRRPSD